MRGSGRWRARGRKIKKNIESEICTEREEEDEKEGEKGEKEKQRKPERGKKKMKE